MQAKILGLTVLGVVAMVAACSDAPPDLKARNTGGTSSGGTTPGSSGGASGSGAVGCPADVAAPVQLATDAAATDVRIVGASVFFRVGTNVVKVGKDGSGRADVYTSKDLVSSFTDGKTLVNVESPDPPNAVLKIGDVGSKDVNEVGTDLNAASTVVFGSDAKAFYLVSDGNDGGDVLYKVDRENPGGVDEIAQTEGVVSDPQVVGATLWYVKDQTEIWKLALDAADAKPVMVTTVTGGCSLAVGTTHLYCASGGVLEQTDMAGANPQKLFDETTSKLASAFGESVVAGDTVVSRSASGDGVYKNVIRSVTAGAEGVVACGRETVGSMGADGTSVAWAETGKGVFLAPMH